jgi:cell division protein FtsN
MNTGTVALQLGAFTAVGRAERGWNTIDKRAGSLTADLTVTFPSVAIGGPTLYRVIVGPFADRSAATDRCEALKRARALDACLVWR